MLVYVNKNFKKFNTINSVVSSFFYKINSIFTFYRLSVNYFFFKLYFFNWDVFGFFFFLKLFFKNNLNILFFCLKKTIKKYSFKGYVANSSSSFVNLISNDVNGLSLNYGLGFSYLRLINIRVLNYLKFKNFFKFLLYIMPLKILNYITLYNQSFGYRKNFIDSFHVFWFSIKTHKYFLNYHL